MSKTVSLEYAAGMFDADGSVTITKRIEQRVESEYRRYQTRCSIMSISPYVPQRFANTFGGKVYYSSRQHINPNWRPAHTWIVVSRDASSFLHSVRDFLINKQEEADCALALEASIQAHKYNLRRHPERQTVLDYRESLRQKITDLKKRSYPLLNHAPN
jgi:hypothetical protein